jgi:adenylyltransferase/sulfurtransferase
MYVNISELDESAFLRYSRHLIIPEVGLEGQRKLKNSSVIVVGAGGLGSPALLYLAAAGVGRIGIADYDTVEMSNLQRQVIYTERDLGRKKVEAAKERIESLNPDVRIETYEFRIDSSNALEILRSYDVIIDGSDNLPTRYLLSDSSVLLSKPFVYGSIYRFDGLVSFMDPRHGPCYRCLYPEPPPPDTIPTCAEGGVLGLLAGIVGSIQAIEAVKYILGVGKLLLGRLLVVDTLNLEFTILNIEKDPECRACSKREITSLIDYDNFCGIREGKKEMLISAQELQERLQEGARIRLVDVREPYETELFRIEGAERIPLSKLVENVGKFESSEEIVVFCHTGIKGARAARILREMGFSKARNLAGGVLAWASYNASKNDNTKS